MVGFLLLLVLMPLALVLLRRQPLASSTPVDRNHLAMARWIERQLGDDMVSCTIPEAQQALAASLLTEFFGDEDHGRKELS